MYVNDLPEFVETNDCRPYLFANEASFLFNSNSDVLQSNINYSLRFLSEWLLISTLFIMLFAIMEDYYPPQNDVLIGNYSFFYCFLSAWTNLLTIASTLRTISFHRWQSCENWPMPNAVDPLTLRSSVWYYGPCFLFSKSYC